jgi:hypothetical protein
MARRRGRILPSASTHGALMAKALSRTSPASRTTRLHSQPSARSANAGPALLFTLRVIEDCRRLRLAWSDKGRQGGRAGGGPSRDLWRIVVLPKRSPHPKRTSNPPKRVPETPPSPCSRSPQGGFLVCKCHAARHSTGRPLCVRSCCAKHNAQHLLLCWKAAPEFQHEAERTPKETGRL